MSEILVVVDRSDHTRRAVEFAVARALERIRSVVIVHVIPLVAILVQHSDRERAPARQKEGVIAAATDQV